MRACGFDRRFPIVVYKGRILDGRTRHAAAKAAKIKPRTVQFKGTDDQARQFVETANLHRRHLTPEQEEERRQARVGRVVEARQEGKSIRAIAEQEEVSKSQVERDLATAASLSPPGTVLPPEGKVTGKDGRQQPATKPDKRCENCARKFPPGQSMRGCEGCKAAKKGRQPGDEPSRRSGVKAGRAAYDWSPFRDFFGGLRRQIDKVGNLYGARATGEAERLDADLVAWKERFKKWFETASRTSAPTELKDHV
jgi:hypothetical protein